MGGFPWSNISGSRTSMPRVFQETLVLRRRQEEDNCIHGDSSCVFHLLSESWNHAAESCFVGDAGASTGAHSSRTFRAPRTFRSSSPKPNRVTERSACRMSFALAPLLLRKIRDPCQDQLRTVFITLLALGRIE